MQTEVIVITGPESSGKTTLAAQLSAHWNFPCVAEVARSYLADKISYQQTDLLKIAQKQYKRELATLSKKPSRIVCDTDLLVIMIWSEVKYGDCDPWIYETFEKSLSEQSTNRGYFLCDSNIPWQADSLRENPNNRNELFKLYLQKLKKYELSFTIVKGDPKQRFEQVVTAAGF
ncbi:MAG: ATP-binding protein [OM182 bacterium]|nr:ATP-binding protein [OM182 bacterium]